MKGIWKRSHRRGHPLWLVGLLVIAGGNTPVIAETIYIGKLATYVNPERVRQQVREECAPEVMLPVMMREEIISRTAIQNVILTDRQSADNEGLTMTLSILSLELPHGAGWTSEKRSLRLKTVLFRDGVVVTDTDHQSDARGAGNFFQKTFRIRKSCHYVQHLVRDASKNMVERFKLMKILPDVESATSVTK